MEAPGLTQIIWVQNSGEQSQSTESPFPHQATLKYSQDSGQPITVLSNPGAHTAPKSAVKMQADSTDLPRDLRLCKFHTALTGAVWWSILELQGSKTVLISRTSCRSVERNPESTSGNRVATNPRGHQASETVMWARSWLHSLGYYADQKPKVQECMCPTMKGLCKFLA